MSSINKPFLNYKEQIKRLSIKGISCNSPEEKKILIRKGYFNLVNGYKKPFVINKDDNNEHIYIKDTSIEKLYQVMKFDRRLSSLILKNVTHVEEEIRSVTAYRFQQICQNQLSDWTSIDVYDVKVSVGERQKLIEDIKEDIKLAKKNRNKYLLHYSQNSTKDNDLPFWVIIKLIRFTTLSTLIKFSKKELRTYLCNLYDIEYISASNDYRILEGALNWLRKTRNACAHMERIIYLEDRSTVVITKYHKLLTSAYIRRGRKKQIVDLLIFLKYFNTKIEYINLINHLINYINEIGKVVGPEVKDNIRASLGIRNIEHLKTIKEQPKSIKYLQLIN